MTSAPTPSRASAATLAPIAETFYSVQGEGKLTGVPSFFVRFAGCNLRCSWCDTPYASWHPEQTQRSVDDLIVEAVRHSGRHAVLTGGEPMIFPQLVPLSQGLAAAGFHITIETAGTIPPPEGGARGGSGGAGLGAGLGATGGSGGLVCDLMSISPKLASSTPTPAVAERAGIGPEWVRRHEQRRINLPALQALLDAWPSPRHQLKFVVTSDADLVEIEDLLSKLTGWGPGDVLLMPEGVELPAPHRREAVLRACLERGWRYCHRLHIELFGHTRGT